MLLSLMKKQEGFVLLPVALFMIAVAAFVGLGMGTFEESRPYDPALVTHERMEVIAIRLSSYAQAQNRIPCPAPAKQDPKSLRFGEAPDECAQTKEWTGVVPFKDLNLNERDVRDGWGNYFTYAVSPVFANPNPKTDLTLYKTCRQGRWIGKIEETHESQKDKNVFSENISKARFCCPSSAFYPAATDAVILKPDGTAMQASPCCIARADTRPTDTKNQAPVLRDSANAVAFVLVSHGANRLKDFSKIRNGRKYREYENADEDREFMDAPLVLAPGLEYFDDFVLWRTQMQLYADLNGATCVEPWW